MIQIMIKVRKRLVPLSVLETERKQHDAQLSPTHNQPITQAYTAGGKISKLSKDQRDVAAAYGMSEDEYIAYI
jgi:hypothetical protein